MRSFELSDFSDLVFKLYRSSNELAPDAFQDAALELTKPLVPFDTSIWGTATMKSSGIDIHHAVYISQPKAVAAVIEKAAKSAN